MAVSNDDAAKNDPIDKLRSTKEKWDAESADSPDGPDETDALLSKAISMAIEQGKGWSSPEERENYLEALLDDDFIPPLFASTPEELERSGLKDAFVSLNNEGETPGKNMLDCRKKGNESVAWGRKNVAKNMTVCMLIFLSSYGRDTILIVAFCPQSTTVMLLTTTTKHITGLTALCRKMMILYQPQRKLPLPLKTHILLRRNWTNCAPSYVQTVHSRICFLRTGVMCETNQRKLLPSTQAI